MQTRCNWCVYGSCDYNKFPQHWNECVCKKRWAGCLYDPHEQTAELMWLSTMSLLRWHMLVLLWAQGRKLLLIKESFVWCGIRAMTGNLISYLYIGLWLPFASIWFWWYNLGGSCLSNLESLHFTLRLFMQSNSIPELWDTSITKVCG